MCLSKIFGKSEFILNFFISMISFIFIQYASLGDDECDVIYQHEVVKFCCVFLLEGRGILLVCSVLSSSFCYAVLT